MPGGEALVAVEEVTRSFVVDGRTIHALEKIDLTIDRGEVLGIIGASGAGKSTLLQMLGALDRPTSGKILFEGRDIFAMKEKDLALFRSRSIGFVFQAHNLLPEFSAVENVALPAMIAGASKNESLAKARKMLDNVGLSQRYNHRPGKLSGGEQQRVAICRALINGPALVLADEPTGNLDTNTGDEIMELIFSLNEENGQTFVIVTHNLVLAKKMSRVVQIKDGKFVDSLNDVLE